MNSLNRLLLMVLALALLTQCMGNLFACLEFKLNLDYLEKYVCVERGKPDSKCKAHCHLKKQLQNSERRLAIIKIKEETEFILLSYGHASTPQVYYDKPYNYLPYRTSMLIEVTIEKLFQPPEYI